MVTMCVLPQPPRPVAPTPFRIIILYVITIYAYVWYIRLRLFIYCYCTLILHIFRSRRAAGFFRLRDYDVCDRAADSVLLLFRGKLVLTEGRIKTSQPVRG